MHKVKELEDKWFNYKMKKLLSPIMRLSVFSLVIAGSYYIYETKGDMLLRLTSSNNMTNVLGVSKDANSSTVSNASTIAKESHLEKVLIVKKEATRELKVLEKIALVPIIPVIDMEKEERILEKVKRHKTTKVVKKLVKAKKNNYLTDKELAVIQKAKKSKTIVPRKTKKMNFTSTSSNYLETMKHKFSRSNSPRDALLIAKTYYKNLDYIKAEKWALSANKLDNSLEDSWLLFAKSKAKLGKKKEALKILVSYYKKSHSLKAKRLIGQIKIGKL